MLPRCAVVPNPVPVTTRPGFTNARAGTTLIAPRTARSSRAVGAAAAVLSNVLTSSVGLDLWAEQARHRRPMRAYLASARSPSSVRSPFQVVENPPINVAEPQPAPVSFGSMTRRNDRPPIGSVRRSRCA